MKDSSGNPHLIINQMYQQGIQYIDSNGNTHNVPLPTSQQGSPPPCHAADGWSGSKHIHSNTFTMNEAGHGRYTYIASIEDQDNWFRIVQYLKWELIQPSDNSFGMNAWWKIDWYIGGHAGPNLNGGIYDEGQKLVNGQWSYILVASCGQKGSNWQQVDWLQDRQHPTQMIYTSGSGGVNDVSKWGYFDQPGGRLINYFDYLANANGNPVSHSIGSEWMVKNYPPSGTLYGSWTQYSMMWN